MNKGEMLCAGLMILTLTKALVEVDKEHPTYPNIVENEILKQYDIRSIMKEHEENYKIYVKEQEEKKRIEEERKKAEEELKKQQEAARIKKEEEEKKAREKAKQGQEVLLEVSFYHDGLITASGKKPKINHTIACPPEVPFGSVISFEGKQYICEDRGGYIKKVWSDKYNSYLYRVDVFVSSEEEAYRLGRYVVKGTIKKN